MTCTHFSDPSCPQPNPLYCSDTATLATTLITPRGLRLDPVCPPPPRHHSHPHRRPGRKGGLYVLIASLSSSEGNQFMSAQREFGMDMYTLLYLKWITNKDPLCSTGDSAACYVVAWMGGEFGGEWTHIYIWLCPFTVHLKLSQHYLFISYTPFQNKNFLKKKECPKEKYK